jgi:hypothetical protein
MSDRDGSSFSDFLRRRVTFIAWAVFLTLVFGFGWKKSAENERESQALSDWSAGYATFSKEADAEWRRLIAYLDSVHAKPGSQKSLEVELNGGQPFELRESDTNARQLIDWSHPKYGGRASFEFENGVLVGRNANWGTPPESLYPRPQAVARTNSAEWLRLRIAKFAGIAWLIGLAIWFVFRRQRMIAAQLLLALALAYGMAQVVNPHYSLTWQGIFSNDPLFFAVVMLAVSVVLLAGTLAARTSNDTLRPQFGVRHALIAITLIAAPLAAGPFGYLTLAVAVLGTGLFAAAFLVQRTHRRATIRWMAERSY